MKNLSLPALLFREKTAWQTRYEESNEESVACSAPLNKNLYLTLLSRHSRSETINSFTFRSLKITRQQTGHTFWLSPIRHFITLTSFNSIIGRHHILLTQVPDIKNEREREIFAKFYLQLAYQLICSICGKQKIREFCMSEDYRNSPDRSVIGSGRKAGVEALLSLFS